LAAKYLLGILNSKVFGWIVRTQSTPLRGGYVKFSKQYIETTPIPQPSNEAHNRMITLVEQMLELHRKRVSVRTGHEQTVLDRQVAATDREIDRLVYDLYGLTEEEIKIVEGTTSQESGTAPVEVVPSASKPKRAKKAKSPYAEPPLEPSDPRLTSEQSYGDAAHYYSAKEPTPPYGKERNDDDDDA
jgi:hypothetical protein